jgi:hypothetical protein
LTADFEGLGENSILDREWFEQETKDSNPIVGTITGAVFDFAIQFGAEEILNLATLEVDRG